MRTLDLDDAHELVAAIRLDVPLDRYRNALASLAQATLSGASRASIDRRRALAARDAWDETLQQAVREGIAKLRELVDAAERDIARGQTQSRVVSATIDRVLFELLEHQDQNHEALAQLEQELVDASPDDRPRRALRAARGAGLAAAIPRNELRAALVRAGRRARRHRDPDEAFEKSRRELARGLATDARRAATRKWVAEFAELNQGHFPLLAKELHRLAVAPPAEQPEQDVIWLEACFGMALAEGLGNS